MPADLIAQLEIAGRVLDRAAPPLTFEEIERRGNDRDDAVPVELQRANFGLVDSAVPSRLRGFPGVVGAAAAVLLVVAGLTFVGGGDAEPVPAPPNAAGVTDSTNTSDDEPAPLSSDDPLADLGLPDGAVPDDLVLRFTSRLGEQGQIWVYDSVGTVQVCSVRHLDDSTGFLCLDLATYNAGLGWGLEGMHDTELLWGLTSPSNPVTITIGDVSVVSDRNGLWYTTPTADATSFTITTSTGTTSFDIDRSVSAKTVLTDASTSVPSKSPSPAPTTPNAAVATSSLQNVVPYDYPFAACKQEPKVAAVPQSETSITSLAAANLRPLLMLESTGVDSTLRSPAGSLSHSDDLRTLALSVDAAGPDTLLVSDDGGVTWLDRGRMNDIVATATSDDGRLVAAASTDGTLSLLSSSQGWTAAPITLPSSALLASGLTFDSSSSLLIATLSQRVNGANDEFANLVNVWTMDIATMTWTQVTDLKADSDRWSISTSPVVDESSGALLFVVESGLGSGGLDDVSSELWSWDPGSGALSMVVPGLTQTLLVAASSATRVWNVADETGTWHLLAEDLASSSLTDLGCGRSVLASQLNGDPDYSIPVE